MYINVWFDFNRDGDWEDVLKCPLGPTTTGLAPEWAVQNEKLEGLQMGLTPLVTRAFRSFSQTPDDPMWMRITLTDGPIDPAHADGSGPLGGYPFGETEDYLVTGSRNEVADICVSKFNDINGNGVYDSNDLGASLAGSSTSEIVEATS